MSASAKRRALNRATAEHERARLAAEGAKQKLLFAQLVDAALDEVKDENKRLRAENAALQAKINSWMFEGVGRIDAAADAVTYGGGVLHGDKHVPAHELYAEQPDPVLCSFYQVETFPDLVKAMERHIEKLQAKVPTLRDTQPGRAREG